MNNLDISTLFNNLSSSGIGKYIMAFIVLIIGYLVAKFIASLFRRLMGKVTFLDRFFEMIELNISAKTVIHVLSIVLYYIILFAVFIAFLDILELDSIKSSLQGIQGKYLPGFIGGATAYILAWVIATLARLGVKKGLHTVNLDRKFNKELLSDTETKNSGSITETLGSAAYWFVFIYFLPSILKPLGLNELAQPVYDINTTIIGYLPKLLGAVIIILISLVIGKIVSRIVTELLKNLGFNSILKTLGLKFEGKVKPSKIAGKLLFTFIMFFAGVEAANHLGLTVISEIATQFIHFAGNVLIGLVVVGIGAYIANIVSDLVKAGTSSKLMPKIAKAAVLILAIAMGLRQIGIAEDIINLAFGLTLGSIAVAAALAFGLGSRDVAGKEIEKFLKNHK